MLVMPTVVLDAKVTVARDRECRPGEEFFQPGVLMAEFVRGIDRQAGSQSGDDRQ